jgi:tetratricopeptide (TPR) repeat protein
MQVFTPERAKQTLHATHALQTTIRREGDTYIAQGSVIDLATGVHLQDFSGRYPPSTLGALTGALTGKVSMALQLDGVPTEVISPAATTPYDRGLYLLELSGSNLADTISSFKEAAYLDPRSPLPLAGMAEAEIREFHSAHDSRHIEQARQYLQSAESLNPDSAKVRLAAGLLNETTSHYEKALEDYQRVQHLEPRNLDALLRIAKVYDKFDIPEKAVEVYQQAIAIDPAYYLAYEDLGEYYYYRGKYPEAAEQFRKTIERAPGMYDAYTNLAAALNDLGMDAEAEQALTASLKLRETARALNSMGALRTFQRKDAEALAYHKRAVAMEPDEYVYWLNLGDVDRRLGLMRDARFAFNNAMSLALGELKENPRSGYTRAFVGYFAAMLGDDKRAEQEMGQALQLSPGDNEVIRCAVLTYEALGERDRAIVALRSSTPELMHELNRQPDLADLRQDSRYQEVAAHIDERR